MKCKNCKYDCRIMKVRGVWWHIGRCYDPKPSEELSLSKICMVYDSKYCPTCGKSGEEKCCGCNKPEPK